ncbi:hypothetical protein V2J09_020660 [Rumex salicifolius]
MEKSDKLQHDLDIPPSPGDKLMEEVNDSPIEEVRLTVPITDDPTMPALTIRTWVLGLTSCIILSFVNQFFSMRRNSMSVSSVAAQIVTLPVGRFMAATLPEKTITVPVFGWTFSLNPGPFNIKEHALITLFASAGSSGMYAVHIIVSVKAFYHRHLNPVSALLLALTTQLLGYGWAGLFRKYLVESPYMWWPGNLVQVSLFRALHEDEKREKGGLTRLQFFILVIITSFSYYTIPGYLFKSTVSISVVCLIWKKSILAQQLGSGISGLGLGAFTLDWNVVTSFLGTPLSTPFYAIINTMVGFVLVVYVILPLTYYSDWYHAKRFPFISSRTFDFDGQHYNISRILDKRTFTFDDAAYNSYSKLYLSVFFAVAYGLNFATLTATISHVALFHGRSIWALWSQARAKINEFSDVHSRIMKRNYEAVPQKWFVILLAVTVGLALFACEGFGGELQLPWWGLLMACALAASFTLPIGIIQATTNIQPGLNVITELLIGYLYPGKPLANVAFKTYGYISMSQALYLISDLKLGHYMKIPPKSMFIVQLVGTMVASLSIFATSWWLITSVTGICDSDLLPKGSPWTCPNDAVFYSASIIWGVVGPARMFKAGLGLYPELNWFFLAGFLAPFPVWVLSRIFPGQKWIRMINMPVILGATAMMPPAMVINYWAWGSMGLLFNYYVFTRYKGWWARYNYVLAAALDAGIAFMAIFIFFSLQYFKEIEGISWWGLEMDDHCPLSTCPTAPGVRVEGCPVF